MSVNPYLFFEGRGDEAISFYKQALGAEVEALMRYKDSPVQAGCPAGAGDKIMHASLKVGDTSIMISDGGCDGVVDFKGFALALTPKDEATAKTLFDALAAGGQVTMPLGKTFWSTAFGMLTDKFGVAWMINVVNENCP